MIGGCSAFTYCVEEPQEGHSIMIKRWPFARSGAMNCCCFASSSNVSLQSWHRALLIESIWIFPFRIPMQGFAISFVVGLVHEFKVALAVIATPEYWLFMMHVKALGNLAFFSFYLPRPDHISEVIWGLWPFFSCTSLWHHLFVEVGAYFFDLTLRSLVIAGLQPPWIDPCKGVR